MISVIVGDKGSRMLELSFGGWGDYGHSAM